MKTDEYIKIHYPAVRVFTADTGRISMEKHYVRSLLEVDVTDALQKLKQMRAPGRKVSFLAWFIKVTADTVAQHPPINGIRKGRNTVWVPRSVDVLHRCRESHRRHTRSAAARAQASRPKIAHPA